MEVPGNVNVAAARRRTSDYAEAKAAIVEALESLGLIDMGRTTPAVADSKAAVLIHKLARRGFVVRRVIE